MYVLIDGRSFYNSIFVSFIGALRFFTVSLTVCVVAFHDWYFIWDSQIHAQSSSQSDALFL